MKSFEELYEELNDRNEHYMFISFVRSLTKEESRDAIKVRCTLRRMEQMMLDGNYDTLSLVR